jgi:hypothetical protein
MHMYVHIFVDAYAPHRSTAAGYRVANSRPTCVPMLHPKNAPTECVCVPLRLRTQASGTIGRAEPEVKPRLSMIAYTSFA